MCVSGLFVCLDQCKELNAAERLFLTCRLMAMILMLCERCLTCEMEMKMELEGNKGGVMVLWRKPAQLL